MWGGGADAPLLDNRASGLARLIGVATTALVEARSRQAHARPPSDPSVFEEVIKAVRAYVEIVEGTHRVGLVDGTMLLAPLTNLPARRRRSKDAPKSTPKAVDTKEPVTDSDEDDAPSSRAA